MSIGYQALITIIGCVGSILFGLLAFRFPNKKRIHVLLGITLIVNGFTHIMRAIHWENGHPGYNQFAYLGLAVVPLILGLFVESVSTKRFNRAQKVFFVFMTIGLFLLGLSRDLLQNKIFLISMMSFHTVSCFFYISILNRGIRESQNLKEQNIISCLRVAIYSVLLFSLVDWAYKFGYSPIRLFPISFSIFIYYISIVIYSTGETRWVRQTVKLFYLAGLSFVFGAMYYLQFDHNFYTFLKVSVSSFALLTAAFAIYNQLHMELEGLFFKSKKLFDWKNTDIDLKAFLSEINEKPEFHHVSVLEESFIKKHSCQDMSGVFLNTTDVASREDNLVLLNKKNHQNNDAGQALDYLFRVTDTDYMVSIPYTGSYLCFKLVNIVNPDLYYDFMLSMAQKVALFKMQDQKETL